MKTWFNITNNADSATISIHDEIGIWGVSSQDFVAQAKTLMGVKNITLSIDSPGGDVNDGLTIYDAISALRESGSYVTADIIGLAASMASVIMLSANRIRMAEHARVMVHRVTGVIGGNPDDLEAGAKLTRQMEDRIIALYMGKTGKSESNVRDLMKASLGTWFFGQEAIDEGFADEMMKGVKAKAFKAQWASKFVMLPAALFDSSQDIMATPSNSTVEEPVVPVTTEETNLETEVVEAPAPAEEEKKLDEPAAEGEAAPAPEAKGIIARALAAFTASKKSGELVASLRTEIAAKDSEINELKASLVSLKEKADIIAKLEAELVEAEKASKTASQKAAEIVAAAGFNPAKQGELPAVTDASTDRSMPRAEWQKLNHYEQARFFNEGGKLTD